MAQGQNTKITILTTVNEGVTTSFVNSATVDEVPNESDNTNNGPVTVSTSVGGSGIDLEVSSITDTPDPVNNPGALQYTAIVVNNGTSTAGMAGDLAEVRIDLPPNGVNFVSGVANNGFDCNLSGSTLTCSGILGGGDSTTITVDLAVIAGAPQELTAVAIADPTDKFNEANEGNNSMSATTTVVDFLCEPGCIDTVMALALGTPNPVQEGATETFTVQVVNVGDTTTEGNGSNNVTVDILVLNSFVGIPSITEPAGWDCSGSIPAIGFFTCAGNLGPGDNPASSGETFEVTATAGAAGGTIDVSAFVTLSSPDALFPDSNPGNNTGGYSTNIVQ